MKNVWLATAYDGTEKLFSNKAEAEAFDYYGEPMFIGQNDGEPMCFIITDEE